MESWRNIAKRIRSEREDAIREAERTAEQEKAQREAQHSADLSRQRLEEQQVSQRDKELLRALRVEELLGKTQREIWNRKGVLTILKNYPGSRLFYPYKTSRDFETADGGGYNGSSNYRTERRKLRGYTFTEVKIDNISNQLVVKDGEYVGRPKDEGNHWENFARGEEIYSYEVFDFENSTSQTTIQLTSATRSELEGLLLDTGLRRVQQGRLPEDFDHQR